MGLDDIAANNLTGIRAYDGLAITAAIWQEAHNQHAVHRLVHAGAAHRPGIVYGLEVVAAPAQEDEAGNVIPVVVVAPGVAIDGRGRTIVVSEPEIVAIAQPGRVFILLTYDVTEIDPASGLIRETGAIRVTDVPDGDSVELARIFHSRADAVILESRGWPRPGIDQVNTLHRMTSFPCCHVDATVAEWPYVPTDPGALWNPNREGLLHLLRAGGDAGFHVSFLGPLAARTSDPVVEENLSLVYMAGTAGFEMPDAQSLDRLRGLLDNQVMLFGEDCGNGAFSTSFRALAKEISGGLQPMESIHELLTSHFVFSAPPPGGSDGEVFEIDSRGTVALSTYNFGGAWQGSLPDPNCGEARSLIRQAQEFGLNLIAYSARHRRVEQLRRIGRVQSADWKPAP